MKHLRRLPALFALVLGLFFMAESSPASAQTTAAVWDLRALVHQQEVSPGDTKSVVTLMFSPPTGVTTPYMDYFEVYRHARGDQRQFNSITMVCLVKDNATSPWAVRGLDCASPPEDPNWGIDPFYGYITYTDTNGGSGLTDYEEYYYFVKSFSDPITNTLMESLDKYVLVAAFPPTQTRHGSYSEYTNACTACHGLHSAKHKKLLKGATVTDLCGTCHDGTGSKYDEVRGMVRLGPSWGKRAYASAGPFGDQLKAGSGVITTSVHNVYRDSGPDWAFVWQAPGSGFTLYSYDNSEPGNKPLKGEYEYAYVSSSWSSKLVCSTCHEPHNRGRNYRILRPVINDRTNILVRGVSEVDSTASNDPACVGVTCDAGDDRGDWSGRAMYTKFYVGTEVFCTACHRAFLSTNAAAPYQPGIRDANVDTAAGASASSVWGGHRHAIGLPAKLAANFPIDGYWDLGTDPGVPTCGMSTPTANSSGDKPCGEQSGVEDPKLPLQGPYDQTGSWVDKTYPDNLIVCLTCHVPHGSGSERIEVAYRNDGANMTQNADRDPVSGYLWNRGDRPTVDGAVYSRWVDLNRNGVQDAGEPLVGNDPTKVENETPVSPGPDLDGDGTVECGVGTDNSECRSEQPLSGLYLPNDSPYWTQYGFSAALARFNPFAQACYRCHGLK